METECETEYEYEYENENEWRTEKERATARARQSERQNDSVSQTARGRRSPASSFVLNEAILDYSFFLTLRVGNTRTRIILSTRALLFSSPMLPLLFLLALSLKECKSNKRNISNERGSNYHSLRLAWAPHFTAVDVG